MNFRNSISVGVPAGVDRVGRPVKAMGHRGMPYALALLIVLLAEAGCSESLSIRTHPPGAKITLDGEPAGVSPLTKTVERGRMAPVRYTIEKDGYVTEDGVVSPRVAPGRIVGMVFTWGILAIFRGPLYYPPVDMELSPIWPAAPGTGAAADPAEKLRQIEDLYEKGLISEREYRRMRSDVLGTLR